MSCEPPTAAEVDMEPAPVVIKSSPDPGPGFGHAGLIAKNRQQVIQMANTFTDDLISYCEAVVSAADAGVDVGKDKGDSVSVKAVSKSTSTDELEFTTEDKKKKEITVGKKMKLERLRRHIRTVEFCDKILPWTLRHDFDVFHLDGMKYNINDLKRSLAEFAKQEEEAEKKYGPYNMARFDNPQVYPGLLNRVCKTIDGPDDNDHQGGVTDTDSSGDWSEASSTQSEIPRSFYSSRLYQPRPLIRSKSFPFLEAEQDDWAMELGGGDSAESEDDSDEENASESSSVESNESHVSMSIIERFLDPFSAICGEQRARRMRLCRTYSLPDLRGMEMSDLDETDSEQDDDDSEPDSDPVHEGGDQMTRARAEEEKENLVPAPDAPATVVRA